MSPTTWIAATCLALVAIPLQDPESASRADLSEERLEQLVAPIALYPDSLLSQILIASTYPLEVVEADRWVRAHPALSGAALEEALKAQDWDPSVKSLCGFPTLLQRMNEDLDWMRDLGDAYLGQSTELMDAVQRMRRQAYEAGNLKSTAEQTVVDRGDTIEVHPASPEVIYVPTYSPVVVYGPGWYYPYWYYPAWYYPPPYGGGFVTFGIGFFWGFGCWSHCDWHHHLVVVDVGAYRRFHTRTCTTPIPGRFLSASGATVAWKHDPVHRAGIAYRSPEVARSVGADPRRGVRELRPGQQQRPVDVSRPPPQRPVSPPPEAPPVPRTRPLPSAPRPGGSPPTERPRPPSPPRYEPPNPGREPPRGSGELIDGFRRHRSPTLRQAARGGLESERDLGGSNRRELFGSPQHR